ncbi:8324_t:CDS:10, partial [Scutellospora calospora]
MINYFKLPETTKAKKLLPKVKIGPEIIKIGPEIIKAKVGPEIIKAKARNHQSEEITKAKTGNYQSEDKNHQSEVGPETTKVKKSLPKVK